MKLSRVKIFDKVQKINISNRNLLLSCWFIKWFLAVKIFFNEIIDNLHQYRDETMILFYLNESYLGIDYSQRAISLRHRITGAAVKKGLKRSAAYLAR